ncbi:MAG: hypothetical protein RSB54_00610 [Bacilli bacterium]
MKSRMDKYVSVNNEKYQRTNKNTKLYEDVYDDIYRDTTYRNMSIIDSAKEIDVNKLKNMLDDKYDTRQYRTFKNYDVKDLDLEGDQAPEKEKIYDINTIINEAKNKRAFMEDKEKEKYTTFTQRRIKNDEAKYDELKEEEKQLQDLINTMTMTAVDPSTKEALDLFPDLKPSENTIVTEPIKSGENNTTNVNTLSKMDRTFYTDSNMFTKNDFEDFTGLSKELNKKNNLRMLILIVLIAIFILTLAFFLINHYFIK